MRGRNELGAKGGGRSGPVISTRRIAHSQPARHQRPSRCTAYPKALLIVRHNAQVDCVLHDVHRVFQRGKNVVSGVSAMSSDMRTLLASNSPACREAVDLFVYRIGRELGSLAAALGGLDALIFTAGIGERAAEIRARVCAGAQWLGISLDDAANAAGGPRISRSGSRASAWVIPTDENLMIARHTRRLLDGVAP